MLLAKEQFCHPNTFWTMAIMIFSSVANLMHHPLGISQATFIYEILKASKFAYFFLFRIIIHYNTTWFRFLIGLFFFFNLCHNNFTTFSHPSFSKFVCSCTCVRCQILGIYVQTTPEHDLLTLSPGPAIEKKQTG